jgi:type II secretory pathway pseudopilin PulG
MKRNNLGFTFVEIIIALGLSAFLLPALGHALSFSIRVASQGEKITQAYNLAKEGMEAVFYIKSHSDPNWKWTDTSPAKDSYRPGMNPDGTWSLMPSITPTPGPETFTRTVYVDPVYRDINDEIRDTGSLDHDTRKVTVIVTWPETGGKQTASLSAYVTKH